MKFIDRFDDSLHMEDFNVGGDVVIFSAEKTAECWHCNWPTGFWSVSFSAPICSEECLSAKWDEYWDALQRAPWSPSDGDPF